MAAKQTQSGAGFGVMSLSTAKDLSLRTVRRKTNALRDTEAERSRGSNDQNLWTGPSAW